MMRCEGVPIDDGHGDVPASRGSKGPDVGHDASEERSGCHDVDSALNRSLVWQKRKVAGSVSIITS